MSAIELTRFAPIGLDELVGEAALLTRVDRKYLVPIHTARDVIDSIDDTTRVLEIDGSRSFAYDSLYFDTADRLSYRLTSQRRRRRFKVRTRHYCDTGDSYFEVKTKGGRGTTVKRRMQIDPAMRGKLAQDSSAFARYALTRGGVASSEADVPITSTVDRLRPALVSRYRRATLLMPGGSRATIDTDLFWESETSRPDGSPRTMRLTEHAIIESKSVGGPSELDRRLWRLGYRPTGISKFGTGTAALHPELPANKWARVLRGPFSERTPS